MEKVLRKFELNLLQEMGYGIDLTRDAETNQKIEHDNNYKFDPERGFVSEDKITSVKLFSGKDIMKASAKVILKKRKQEIVQSL